MEDILFKISVWAIPVIMAITLHEAAHGYVAWKLGDDTAFRMGRVTFNPIKHIDPVGTIILPAMLLFASGGKVMFGAAKPVPVDVRRLNRPRRDMVLVAIAGPAMNIAIAITCAISAHALVYAPSDVAQRLAYNIFNAIWINVLLAVFNMLPIPPLDGGRVAVGLLPASLARPLARLERVGFLIILGMIFGLPLIGEQLGMDLNVFWWLVGTPSEYIMQMILDVTGIR